MQSYSKKRLQDLRAKNERLMINFHLYSKSFRYLDAPVQKGCKCLLIALIYNLLAVRFPFLPQEDDILKHSNKYMYASKRLLKLETRAPQMVNALLTNICIKCLKNLCNYSFQNNREIEGNNLKICNTVIY